MDARLGKIVIRAGGDVAGGEPHEVEEPHLGRFGATQARVRTRRIIADSVRDAGFTPLMLEPIDFNGLYMQQLAAQEQQLNEGAPAGNA